MLKRILGFVLLIFASVGLLACGGNEMVTLGTYDATEKTFTPLQSTAGYSLTQNGNTLTLSGTIPFVEGVLGIEAGNIVAIRFTPPAGTTVGGEDASVRTTNRESGEDAWNEYGEEAFEEDGSLIWITKVSKEDDVQIKIKWNANTAETTYTLTVADSATLATNA